MWDSSLVAANSTLPFTVLEGGQLVNLFNTLTCFVFYLNCFDADFWVTRRESAL